MTLHCAERGYILIRIRDEMKMTVKAYQELYESVIANWIRKTLLASIFCFVFQSFNRNLGTYATYANLSYVVTFVTVILNHFVIFNRTGLQGSITKGRVKTLDKNIQKKKHVLPLNLNYSLCYYTLIC